jgi:hypothetical protein
METEALKAGPVEDCAGFTRPSSENQNTIHSLTRIKKGAREGPLEVSI